MMTLIAMGLALGLDSFQVSLGLGILKPSFRRQASIALTFGLCDGLAPLAGLMIGQTLSSLIQAWAGYAGPSLLGLYGLYMIAVAWYGAKASHEENARWNLLGLPICLSVDNLAAGVGLGMLGYPALLSAVILGALSGGLSFAGLSLGRVIGSRLPFQSESVAGMVLCAVAGFRAADWF